MGLVTALLAVALGSADARADDDLVGVAVLPVPGSHSLGPKLEAALSASLPAGFRLTPLPESLAAVHRTQPECRALPRCLDESTPGGVDLLLDAAIEDRAGGTVVTLRVLVDQKPQLVASWFVTARTLTPTARDEVRRATARWALDVRHFRAASSGSADSGAALQQRFPDSPWTRALKETPPPSRAGEAAPDSDESAEDSP